MRRAQGDGLRHRRVLLRSRLTAAAVDRCARALVGAFAFVAIALGVASARASEGQPLLGNEAAISAGAVVASGKTVGMAWYNPAGLAQVRRGRVEMSTEAFAYRVLTVDRGMSTSVPDRTAGMTLRSRELVVVPGASVWAFRVAKRTTAAISVFVPRFDAYDIAAFDRDRHRRIELAQQLGVQHGERRYQVGPSIAWEVTPKLRIGASAFVVYDRIARSTRVAAWAFDTELGHERFVTNEVSESIRSWGGEAVAGVQWAPVRNASLGLAVRSGPIWLTQRTTTSGIGSQGGTDAAGNTRGDLDFIALDAGVVRPRDPIQVDAGVGYRVGRTTFEIDGVFGPRRRGNVDDARRPTLAIRAGTTMRVGKEIVLGGGVHATRGTTVIADDFLDFAATSWGLAVGGQWRHALILGSRERAPTLVFTPTFALHYTQSRGTAGRLRVDLTRIDQIDRDVEVIAGAPGAMRRHHLGLHIGSGLEF